MLGRRGNKKADKAVELFRSGPGLVVRGEPGVVAQFVDDMLQATGRAAVVRSDATSAIAVAAHIHALVKTQSSSYVELSPKSVQDLNLNGPSSE